MGGLTPEEVASFLPGFARVRRRDVFYPVSRVWCMGFAWSSFVAQSTLLACCRSAGFRDSVCLCNERPTPDETSEAYALATDDVMHFTTSGPELSGLRMDNLDEALVSAGIEKHPFKDELAVTDGTCLGTDLSEGTYFTAHGLRLALLLLAVIELVRVRRCSPKQLHSVIGIAQWIFLLNRPLFAALDASYAFTRLTPELEVLELWPDVVTELVLIISLAPYFEADLSRTWAPFLAATDASVEYGFGASIARCTPKAARQVGRLAETRGAYVRLTRDGGATDEPERPRLGEPHRLNLSKQSFRDVISMRRRHMAHPGSLEASGLLLLLRWISRSRLHHSLRVPILVDAQAVLGAAAKGRTSANSIKRDLCNIAAVTLASNMLAAYVYIPREENPADAPSRGVNRFRVAGKARPGVLKKLPVRKRIGKVSNQMLGRPWWRSTDDPVADYLGRLEGDEKASFEGLLNQFE